MATSDRGFTYPEKPRPGDRAAVLSPSAGLPAVFPAVYEQGLGRIREVFGLIPVEYPTTRKMDAPPERTGARRARRLRGPHSQGRLLLHRGARTRSSC